MEQVRRIDLQRVSLHEATEQRPVTLHTTTPYFPSRTARNPRPHLQSKERMNISLPHEPHLHLKQRHMLQTQPNTQPNTQRKADRPDEWQPPAKPNQRKPSGILDLWAIKEAEQRRGEVKAKGGSGLSPSKNRLNLSVSKEEQYRQRQLHEMSFIELGGP